MHPHKKINHNMTKIDWPTDETILGCWFWQSLVFSNISTPQKFELSTKLCKNYLHLFTKCTLRACFISPLGCNNYMHALLQTLDKCMYIILTSQLFAFYRYNSIHAFVLENHHIGTIICPWAMSILDLLYQKSVTWWIIATVLEDWHKSQTCKKL
jgi:hypothetical protein